MTLPDVTTKLEKMGFEINLYNYSSGNTPYKISINYTSRELRIWKVGYLETSKFLLYEKALINLQNMIQNDLDP